MADYLHGWPNHRARIRWESARLRWYAVGTWGRYTQQQEQLMADLRENSMLLRLPPVRES